MLDQQKRCDITGSVEVLLPRGWKLVNVASQPVASPDPCISRERFTLALRISESEVRLVDLRLYGGNFTITRTADDTLRFLESPALSPDR